MSKDKVQQRQPPLWSAGTSGGTVAQTCPETGQANLNPAETGIGETIVTLDFRQIEDNQWEVFKISPAADKPIGLIVAKAGEHSFFPYVWQQPLELDSITLRGVLHHCDYLKQPRPQEAAAETKPVRIVDKAEPLATDLDSVKDRILKAFDEIETADGYLSDSDLLRASGATRDVYLKARYELIAATNELVCLEPDVDDIDSLYPLYHRVRSHAEELAGAEAA